MSNSVVVQLLTRKAGGAFFEEGGDAFAEIGGAPALTLQPGLDGQLRGQVVAGRKLRRTGWTSALCIRGAARFNWPRSRPVPSW